MQTLRTGDGRRLAYNEIGTGPTLVCHSGGPGFAGAALGDLGGLSSSRTLVVLDPRGTGGSERASGYSLDGYAADLDELRVHLGLERMDLLGFSHGAVVAIHYAARHGEGVDRLVLAGGLAAFTDEMKQFADDFIESKSGEPWHDDAVDALAEEENGELDDLEALWQREAPLYFSNWDESYRQQMVEGARGASAAPLREFNENGFDVRPELASISAPTLIVCGRDDFICGPPAAKVLQHGISGAKTEMLERCGHMMFIGPPDSFRHAVAAFLSAET